MKFALFTFLAGCGLVDGSLDLVTTQHELLDPYLVEVADGINAAVGCAAVYVGKTSRLDIRVRITEEPLQEPEIGEFVSWVNEINLAPGIFDNHDEAIGVLVHELGHAFGLAHEPNTIMNAVYDRAWLPDQAYASLADLLNEHGIKPCQRTGKH